MTDHQPAPHPDAAPALRPALRAGWDLRLLRAVPFALVCTVVATAGHTMGGGGTVAVPTLLLGFTLVAALAVLLGGRERSLLGIAGALGSGQLGLHLLFHGTGHQMMAGMTMDQAAGRLVCNDLPGLPHTLPAGTSPAQLLGAAGLDPSAYHAAATAPWWQFGLSPAMLLGHLLAAVLAGWWLRRGEAALWRVIRLAHGAAREARQQWTAPLGRALALVAAVLRGLLAVAGAGVRGPCPDTGNSRPPVVLALRHSVIRRGPPVAARAR
ncbi:hypothetical protein OG455_20580 [Kitasatospora sp. NBC_01287]|uniref:hypothetical protein n=1 Tax=Kitasatospora sp. NBC_01287 TaxID=2903573 RepID=UPI002251BFAA|nr:hypothetical protein [Kitasatospora sp. NBC_01287]MCX4747884.1 hypothetical protein [Kitasatospora sp. NBC_01287]